MAEPPSSPPGEHTSQEDALSWYKYMYESIENELAEFRESSKELEEELEKDIEHAEKQERVFREQAETLGYEVEEWKRKYKDSKNEANVQQTALEKEITTLRESSRGMQLKLRDIEVANDDFERQARNTTSSLEDMEQKYNQAIERAVLMEEEIRIGEQERETLRIEAQRLREELSDLKVEAELLADKLNKRENEEKAREAHISMISTDLSTMGSPTFDKGEGESAELDSQASSPLVTTPPEEKTEAAATTTVRDPPSPPMSDASAPLPKKTASQTARTPGPAGVAARRSRLPSADASATPKPKGRAPSASARPGARPSFGTSTSATPLGRTPAHLRTRNVAAQNKLPASNSLSHIRTLTAQMARLEARVHSARSKLPAPTQTPPRASPRTSLNGTAATPSVPSSVTIRSRKRTVGSSASSAAGDDPTPNAPSTTSKPSHVPRLSTSGISRLSFGPGPLPNRNPDSDMSRPSSRASMSSYTPRPSSRAEIAPPRPMSRTSLSGARTPMGHRPRSSMGMSVHGHSQSVSHAPPMDFDEAEEEEFADGRRTPSRRGTYSKFDADEGAKSGIPMPGIRRQSSGVAARRTSTTANGRPGTATGNRKLSDLGETY